MQTNFVMVLSGNLLAMGLDGFFTLILLFYTSVTMLTPIFLPLLFDSRLWFYISIDFYLSFSRWSCLLKFSWKVGEGGLFDLLGLIFWAIKLVVSSYFLKWYEKVNMSNVRNKCFNRTCFLSHTRLLVKLVV